MHFVINCTIHDCAIRTINGTIFSTKFNVISKIIYNRP